MTHKKRITLVSVVIGAILVIALGLPAVSAQDDSMITCDSTVITLLYVAEHDYGYVPMTDISNIDMGQFAPLFDAMMTMQGEMDMTEEPQMDVTEEPQMDMTEEPQMDVTEEPGMEMTHLEPGVVADENEVCTSLRAELEQYLFDQFQHDMMMSEGS
jgi:hypothetical protein